MYHQGRGMRPPPGEYSCPCQWACQTGDASSGQDQADSPGYQAVKDIALHLQLSWGLSNAGVGKNAFVVPGAKSHFSKTLCKKNGDKSKYFILEIGYVKYCICKLKQTLPWQCNWSVNWQLLKCIASLYMGDTPLSAYCAQKWSLFCGSWDSNVTT